MQDSNHLLNDPDALRKELETKGFLLIRDVHDREQVLAARLKVRGYAPITLAFGTLTYLLVSVYTTPRNISLLITRSKNGLAACISQVRPAWRSHTHVRAFFNHGLLRRSKVLRHLDELGGKLDPSHPAEEGVLLRQCGATCVPFMVSARLRTCIRALPSLNPNRALVGVLNALCAWRSVYVLEVKGTPAPEIFIHINSASTRWTR